MPDTNSKINQELIDWNHHNQINTQTFIDFLNENKNPENEDYVVVFFQYGQRGIRGKFNTVTIKDSNTNPTQHKFDFEIIFSNNHIVVNTNKFEYGVCPFINLFDNDPEFSVVQETLIRFLRTKSGI